MQMYKLLYQGSVKYIDKEGNERYSKGNAVFVQKDFDGNIVGGECKYDFCKTSRRTHQCENRTVKIVCFRSGLSISIKW